MIFGPFEPHRRQLEFPKILNERKIIESIEPIDSIERSRDRSYRSEAAVFNQVSHFFLPQTELEPQDDPAAVDPPVAVDPVANGCSK